MIAPNWHGTPDQIHCAAWHSAISTYGTPRAWCRDWSTIPEPDWAQGMSFYRPSVYAGVPLIF